MAERGVEECDGRELVGQEEHMGVREQGVITVHSHQYHHIIFTNVLKIHHITKHIHQQIILIHLNLTQRLYQENLQLLTADNLDHCDVIVD